MNRSINVYYLSEAKKEKKDEKRSFLDKVKDKTVGVGKHLKKNWRRYAFGAAMGGITANAVHGISSRVARNKKFSDYVKNKKANDNAMAKSYIDSLTLKKPTSKQKPTRTQPEYDVMRDMNNNPPPVG